MSVICVCGAGGKTGYIEREAAARASRGEAVLVLTSTHVAHEDGYFTDAYEAREAVGPGRVVRAGAEDPERPGKLTAFPEDARKMLMAAADTIFIEADGARHMRMKAPYTWEPVIEADPDELVILYSPRAAGSAIDEACYNPEGVIAALRESGACPGEALTAEHVLTEEEIRAVLRRTYAEPLAARFPRAEIRILPGEERTHHLLVMAAGYSRRFRGNKLLYPIEGRPMYAHVTDPLLELIAGNRFRADLTVVTQYEEIRRALLGTGVRVALNPDPSRGIASSLTEGLLCIMAGGRVGRDDLIVVFPADQPYLARRTTEAFLSKMWRSPKRLGAMCDEGGMRSPCAFAAEYIPELMALTGDRGGKRVLLSHADEVLQFFPENAEELEDVDSL